MPDDIKISIVVPAYNNAPWLPRCLDSLLAQTHTNIEILVVDDGSTDDTGSILDRYAAKDCRIIAIHQKNAGLVAVREKGISMATGDYVGFVDGDDSVTPDMYQRLLENALKYHADISHCGMSFIFEDGHTEYHYGSGKIRVQSNFEGQKELLEGQEIEPSLCNKLYRRNLLKDSCLDLKVLNNEDLLRNFILFQRSKNNVYEDFCGYQYYQYSNSMSKNAEKRLATTNHILQARTLILEHCTEPIYPYAKRLLLSTYVNTINHNILNQDLNMIDFCKKCRTLLWKEKKDIHYLIKRQQLAAYLILYFPWLHRLMYKIYSHRR